MQDIYSTFEFDKIKENISNYAKSEIGKELIASIKKLDSLEVVKNKNEELSEAMDIISRFGNIPISNSANILKLIEIAHKSGLFSIRDLSLIKEDILTSNKVINYFKNVDYPSKYISEKISKFSDLNNMEKELNRTITASLTIDDKASAKLKEIRSKLKALEESLNSKITNIASKYSSYLSEVSVTIRDGHFVLPVKTAYKNKVLGIIYDVSTSGNTTFIEPLEIVQINNDISSLKLEENIEIRRILKMLTDMVLLQEDEVRNNNLIIGELDFLQAKSLYALNNNMHIAKISESQGIHLYQARHPLIDEDKVVANDYHLDINTPIVIISGPNAGGKTVSLKVVGLLTLMFLSGLAIPTKEAEISYFNHIYIDIGDNQSLSDNLSTFSAHMKQIGEILNLVKGKDLVLLDELGTGTDPLEGEAIALGVIKYLESKHPLCLISSHFNKVKEYALNNERIENSSLLFDEDNLLPTYKYKYSIPGRSYGLEVASRYGVRQEVINEAKKILEAQNCKSGEIIATLTKKVQENEKLIKENEILKDRLLKEAKEIENQKEMLTKNKANLLSDVKIEKEKMLEDLELEISKIKKELNQDNLKLHEVNEIALKIEDLKDEVEISYYDEDILVNDYVYIPSMNIYGHVNRLNKDKATLLSDEGLTLTIDKRRLHKVEYVKKNNTKRISSDKSYIDKINTSLKLELNIIGLHKDEAKEKLIKYLDDCRIKNFKVVRIIHGFGNGVLRKMVHEYLSTQKDLSFRLGDINEGGGGATVISFHD